MTAVVHTKIKAFESRSTERRYVNLESLLQQLASSVVKLDGEDAGYMVSWYESQTLAMPDGWMFENNINNESTTPDEPWRGG